MINNLTCTADQIDYIISYRESSDDRKRALMYVTSWVLNLFPQINIIIVEQDSSKKLVDSEWPYCQIVFVFNDGLFNRAWSNNVGITHSVRPFLVFADCDIFLDKPAYQSCFEALQCFEAVDPKQLYIHNVALLCNPTLDNYQACYEIKDQRYGNTFAGGIFMIRRHSVMAIGMWDEQFEGWGGEDNVMEHVIRLMLRQCRLQLEVFHIDHVRSVLDTKLQPQYQFNRERSRVICADHGLALLQYVDKKKSSNPGATDKYRRPKVNVCEDYSPDVNVLSPMPQEFVAGINVK